MNNRVQKFSSTGTFLAKWGSEGSGDGQFSSAYDVAVDSSDKVYIVDTGNYRIQKFSLSSPNPTITSITPDNGVNTGTVSITNLAGTGFLAGATVKLTKAGQADISATGVTIDSATKITCTFDLSGAAAGTWNVVVTNTDTKTGTLTYGFTVYNPAPTITSITPNNGVNTGTISITNLAGTGFLAGATVKLTKAGQSDISATGVTVDSATKITCTFDLSGAAAGSWFVEVMNPGSLTGVVNLFTVISSGSSTSLGSSSSDSDYSPPVAVISAAERAAKDAADKAAKDAAAKEANEKAAKEAADKVAANKAIRDALEKEYRDAIEKGRQESEAQAAAQKASISDIYLASKNNANPNGKQDVVQQQKESVISNARTVNSIFDFLIVNSARALDNLPVAADILQPLSPEFKMGYAAVTEYQPQPQLSFALDQYQLITDVINDKPSSVIQEDIAKSLISGSLLFVPAEPGGILSRLLDASKYIGFAENYQESIFWK